MKLSKSDVLLGGGFVAALVVGGWALFGWKQPPPSTANYPSAREIHVKAQNLLGSHRPVLGSGTEPYTLVEFADYECPPCRGSASYVKKVIAAHRGTVKFVFRNLPLVGMHPHAMSAALLAEAAQTTDHFWQMHDKLMGCSNLPTTITELSVTTGFDLSWTKKPLYKAAEKQIKADIADAARVGAAETPSFFLLCPQGKIYRLYNLGDMEQILEKS